MNTRHSSLKRCLNLIAVVTCLTVANHAAAQPMHIPAIFNIVLDASGSVTPEDFEMMNWVVAEFSDLLQTRAILHNMELADWLSVNWFGGYVRSRDYKEQPFVNCSSYTNIRELKRDIVGTSHPRYGYTAIYNAIIGGTNQIIAQDETLPGTYFKMLVVVTDGKENDSTLEAKRSIRQFYPNEEIFFVMVGVGDKAKVDEFEGVADLVIHIDQFDELLATLTILLELLSGVDMSGLMTSY